MLPSMETSALEGVLSLQHRRKPARMTHFRLRLPLRCNIFCLVSLAIASPQRRGMPALQSPIIQVGPPFVEHLHTLQGIPAAGIGPVRS
jgi:hypothetical protein